MGEIDATPMRPTFNRSLSIEGRPEKLSADAGVVALRELDNLLGVVAWLATKLADPRDPRFVTHPLVELLRARIYLMALGHGAQDHVDRLRDDPACRLGTSSRRSTTPLDSSDESPGGLASQPTQSRLVAALSSAENLAVLDEGLFESTRRHLMAMPGGMPESFTIDVDSMPVKVHGQQKGSEYNGYYERRVYHPLVTMLSETGHWVSAELRPGNVGTAEGAEEHLLNIVARVQGGLGKIASIRGDAGFPSDKLLNALERKEIPYVFRLKTNTRLQALAEPYLKRPVGRPPQHTRTWFHELSYAGRQWSAPRRIVLVVIDEPGELYLRHFFLVTNWEPDEYTGEQLLTHYRQRGTMEGHIGELSSVLAPALSCTSRPKSHVGGQPPRTTSEPRDGEAANAATFLLYAYAYNLSNSLRLIMNAERPNCTGSHGDDTESAVTLPASEAINAATEGQQAKVAELPTDGRQANAAERPTDGRQADAAEPPTEGQQADAEADAAELPTEGQQADAAEPPTEGQQADAAEPPTEGQQADATEPPTEGQQADAAEPPTEGRQTDTPAPPTDRSAEVCGCGHSLSRLQTAILRTPARFVVSGRRVTMVLANQVADLWRDLWRGLERLEPVPVGSAPT